MTIKPHLPSGIALVALTLGACSAGQAPLPVEMPPPPAIVAEAERAQAQVRSTIVGGEAPVPQPPSAAVSRPVHGGNVSLNLPRAEVRAVAASVQQVTGIRITVDPDVNGQVTLVTPGSVARNAIVGLFETALRPARLALVPVGEGFVVRTEEAARAPVAPDAPGFGTEVITLEFINAEEVRKVLDSAIPGVVTDVDSAGNRITIAGTTGQRSSARDLLKQFDVNWLRNMSFGLYIPERTDARLIVPELEKLINADDAPTRGLVRLIAMERLNGILAISAQEQYLADVQRWVDILDREGENAERRIFVYKVQNGRASDLARTLNRAYGKSVDETDDMSDPFGESDRSAGRTASLPRTPRAADANGANNGRAAS
ncbi:MAG: hypothetical protein P8Y58_16340, partial [Novosphingobium sp.]